MKDIAIEKLKEQGLEIWMENPKDENAVMITLGTLRKMLVSMVPENHVVVPVEPNAAMRDAMAEVLYGHTREEAVRFVKLDKYESCADEGARAYRAAIAARGQ